MSQIQKLRAKQNKIKIGFTFEKTTTGIEITVKSPKLGGLLAQFYTKYSGMRYSQFDEQEVNPMSIIRSLDFIINYANNQLINGQFINLSFLKPLMTQNKTKITHKISNVFTNDEIKSFIVSFETYLIKVKQLNNEDNRGLV